ncbi:hypothetical protein B0A48_04126 [Cryoendolithus antarcticus]|uniref:Uncharacterized protein n=1 Tax=Cryoendolithus antarcticus TaxID=1507870 RepID=A0A1V8THH2_9PEZI|nr:hypothetical protein B0A48_04126 [Cryoendolithus antarcticus]
MSATPYQHVSHSNYKALGSLDGPDEAPSSHVLFGPDVTLLYREASGNNQALPLLYHEDICYRSLRLTALLRPGSGRYRWDLELAYVNRLTAFPLIRFLRSDFYRVTETTALLLRVQMYKLGEIYRISGLSAFALEQLVAFIRYTGATGTPVSALPDAVRSIYSNQSTDPSFKDMVGPLVQCVKQGFEPERFREDWVMVQLMEDLPHFHHALCDASTDYYRACMAAETPQIAPQQKETSEALTFAQEFAARSCPDGRPRGVPYELVHEAEEILERLPLVKKPAQIRTAQANPGIKPAPKSSRFARFFAEHYDAEGRLIKPPYDRVRGAQKELKQVGFAGDSPQMQTKPQTCSACAGGQDEAVNLFDQRPKGNERSPSLLSGDPGPSQNVDDGTIRLRQTLPRLDTSVPSTHELDARPAWKLQTVLPIRLKGNGEAKSASPRTRSTSSPHGSNLERMSRLTLDLKSCVAVSIYDPSATPDLAASLQPDRLDGNSSNEDRVASSRQILPRLNTSVPRTDEYEPDKAACKTPIWECESADGYLLEGPGNFTYSPASPEEKSAPKEELNCLDGDGSGHNRVANLRQTLSGLDTSVPRTYEYISDAAACRTPSWECETADES